VADASIEMFYEYVWSLGEVTAIKQMTKQ